MRACVHVHVCVSVNRRVFVCVPALAHLSRILTCRRRRRSLAGVELLAVKKPDVVPVGIRRGAAAARASVQVRAVRSDEGHEQLHTGASRAHPARAFD
jgi:hypothetical protein